MTELRHDPLLFENDEWALTPAGLEHRQTGYFIEAEQIGDRRSDGLWAWPVHMAEKAWCRPEAFAEAFMQALAAGGLEPDADLARSFAAAGHGATHQAVWDHVAQDLVGHQRQGSPLSLAEVITISDEMGRRTGLGGRTGRLADHSAARAGAAEPRADRSASSWRRAPSRRERFGRAGIRIVEWLRGGYRTESEHVS